MLPLPLKFFHLLRELTRPCTLVVFMEPAPRPAPGLRHRCAIAPGHRLGAARTWATARPHAQTVYQPTRHTVFLASSLGAAWAQATARLPCTDRVSSFRTPHTSARRVQLASWLQIGMSESGVRTLRETGIGFDGCGMRMPRDERVPSLRPSAGWVASVASLACPLLPRRPVLTKSHAPSPALLLRPAPRTPAVEVRLVAFGSRSG
ncbi:hypothetical protein B0H10DRAFT_2223210 [Mycena sp. CBHHK59/15]|nr:hypothetical protein B0H10DRAFT_2223210 [Mycena sp. CBHHK59/15]